MDRVTELHSSNRSRDRRESGLKSSWRTDRQTSSRASLARCARHSRPSPGPKQHCYQAGSVTSATRRMQALESSRKRIRKPRGKGLRTKTGCLTCRKRHKKCDERQPVCGPCSLSSRDCLYADVESRRNGEAGADVIVPSPSQATRRPESLGLAAVDEPPSRHRAAALADATSLSPSQAYPLPSLLVESDAYSTNPSIQVAQALQRLDGGHQLHYSYSPDTVASEYLTADLASTRWLDLLATDAAQADKGFSLAPTRHPSPVPEANDAYNAAQADVRISVLPAQPVSTRTADSGSPTVAREPENTLPAPAPVSHAWQLDQDICLQSHEADLFRTFAERAALWLDLFDPCKHFSTHATRLALRNLGLMKAILALSSRRAIAKLQAEEADASEPVQYYYETLHYVQEALQYTSYTRSEELLATAIIISTYEMLDDSNSNWKRHLKGVFWIQRSQDVNGASGGLRQAVWWAWLRQDLWAAFREKRACFSFWRPVKDCSELTQDELADKAVYLLSQAVNYCAATHTTAPASIADKIQSGQALLSSLERWKTFLGPAYQPLPSPQTANSVFKSIWIHPPQFAVALQVYHFATILITLHRPAVAGFQGYLQTQRVLSDAVDSICGIAKELKDEGSQILSAQCLFGAGLCTQDPIKRESIISLINDCESRTEWPMSTLTADLRAEWAKFS